jgi:hypothetical protein
MKSPHRSSPLALLLALNACSALSLLHAQPAPATPIPVTIAVDAAKTAGPLRPIYRFFGADEPNYAYMKDGRKLLKDIGSLGAPQEYFRTHGLLMTGDGTPALKWGSTHAYTEDATGKPAYSWTAGTATLRFNLPREGVCLLVLEVP